MTPYYLEDSENKLFIDVNFTENSFRIRRGHIGKPCLVFEGTSDRSDILKGKHESIKTSFLEKGYQEKKREQEIIEGSKAGILRKPEILANPAYAQLMKMAYMEEDFKDKNCCCFGILQTDLLMMMILMLLCCATHGTFQELIIEGDVNINGVFYN